jgi:hypothetical protein
MKSLNTPLRRLDGIAYWVIEDPDDIRDHINKEIRKEWETDARQEHHEPENDPWLKTLSKRKWSLQDRRHETDKVEPYDNELCRSTERICLLRETCGKKQTASRIYKDWWFSHLARNRQKKGHAARQWLLSLFHA